MVHKESQEQSPRSRRRARKFQEILDAAESLLLEGGPEAVTIRGVASRIDMAVGALYRYFPSKEAIMAGVGGRMVSKLGIDLDESVHEIKTVEQEDGPLVSSLFAIIWVSHRYYERCLESYELYQLANMMLVEQRRLLDPGQRKVFMADVFDFLGQVAGLFEDAATKGALSTSNPMERALILWSSHNGNLQLRKLGREDSEIVHPSELQKQLVTTLLLGWGADSGTLQRAWARLES